MSPGDISDVPTVASLNKSQKRALILRDQLRYLTPTHLDSFIDGVTADEPPTYSNVNGAVLPRLAQVTIKEEATRFDLGNVLFPEEDGAIYRAFLTVEDGRFEMRTSDPLPKDDAELASVTIHRFVAENMFPLFKVKYKAIYARMEKINEARRVAYNMLGYPPAKFEDGETVARLNPAKPRASENTSRSGSSRKRKEIVKHTTNKRQRVGLDAIPDNVKSEAFNLISAQIKVDLFNDIVKTALPNFDNLLVASWNVVSVYANVGSDFPELHKAVVELRGALEDFESAYVPTRSRNERNKKEATAIQQRGRTMTPVKETRRTPVPTVQTNVPTVIRAQLDGGATEQRSQEGHDEPQDQMLPPSIPQASQQQDGQRIKEDEDRPELFEVARTDSPSARSQSVPQPAFQDDLILPRPSRSCTPLSTSEHHLIPPRGHAQKIRHHSIDMRSGSSSTRQQAPGSELMRKRQEYTASLSAANRKSVGTTPCPHIQQGDGELQYDKAHNDGYELRRLGSTYAHGPMDGSKTNIMGKSMLGAKRQTGMAPVAPMMPTRKESGGTGGSTCMGRREK